jgi:hypothetical protein
MPKIFNVADFIKIGVIAFAFIFIANYALKRAGLSQFTTAQ